jgi:hypothetical protein
VHSANGSWARLGWDAKARVSTYNSTRRCCFRKDGRAGDDTDTGMLREPDALIVLVRDGMLSPLARQGRRLRLMRVWR